MTERKSSSEGWTIDTLKELIASEMIALRQHSDDKINHLTDTVRLKFDSVMQLIAARDKAVELQTAANTVHFEALNHENLRVAKAAEVSVSRDTWDEFLKNYQEWKGLTDRAILERVPRSEFQSYRETTQTALTLKSGQTEGVGKMSNVILSIILALAGIASIAGVLFALARH